MKDWCYQFRPNGHWNIVTEEVYAALLRAGYDNHFLKSGPR